MKKKKINNKIYDNKIFDLINKEYIRQKNQINLIASESYSSIDVMKAQGSCLTNKYSEGYPNKRYYEGCKYVDEIEKIAIMRAKKIFDCDYVNVQPHSGSQANLAVYNSLLNIGDTVLSMDLKHGGHLTHGSIFNISSKLYNFKYYKLNKKGEINYNNIYKLSKLYKPKMIIAGSSSFSGIIDWKKISNIAKKFNSYFFVDMSHIAGLVAAKIYPNPIYFADIVSSTTHKTLSGPRGGIILSKNKDISFYNKIDKSVFPGIQGGPLMHVIAAKAICFKEAMSNKYIIYQKNIIKNIKQMANIFKNRNIKLVSDSIESNLLLLDLRKYNLTGLEISNILNNYNIIVNKNLIPNDKLNSNITSGIRIGTTSITRRNITPKYINIITNIICNIITDIKYRNKINNNFKKIIYNICKKFPIY
ncbi:serine hydroxymethyltransferase [endosymbiont of Euscepes postfasciatus]|uniref:serine hydroxymethyltransferase n=1 Tax=endosymbiont of Euscepes postfasciatus TaxID=650377 RepID=UPI000DC6D34D|nr:serine hydroxymethyltransferase [endosymbiont of Euscepes postfasciatus]BBA84610.1 serine hydroxymethyltransferase [endosymbiont of Euscepes postfasciatus]